MPECLDVRLTGCRLRLNNLGENSGNMKNYIGVKIVKAEPKEKNGVPGYAVKYPDGYVSWSPKEIFEKAYRELDFQDFINSVE